MSAAPKGGEKVAEQTKTTQDGATTLGRVIEAVERELKPSVDVSESSMLYADLRCDSLDVTELVMVLEDEFGIEIPDEEMQGVLSSGDASIGDVAAFVQTKLG